jgi:hypothetical protein
MVFLIKENNWKGRLKTTFYVMYNGVTCLPKASSLN